MHCHQSPKSPTRRRKEQFPGFRLRGAVRPGFRAWVRRQLLLRAVLWAWQRGPGLCGRWRRTPTTSRRGARRPPPAGEPDPGPGGPELPVPPLASSDGSRGQQGLASQGSRAVAPQSWRGCPRRMIPEPLESAADLGCSCRCWFCWRRPEAALPITEPIREPGMPATRSKAAPATAPMARARPSARHCRRPCRLHGRQLRHRPSRQRLPLPPRPLYQRQRAEWRCCRPMSPPRSTATSTGEGLW